MLLTVRMSRTHVLAAACLAAVLPLASCGGDGNDGGDAGGEAGNPHDATSGQRTEEEREPVTEPAAGRVTTQDGSVSLVLPRGWVKYAAAELDGVVVLAANQADDRGEQVFVSSFEDAGAAEDAAIYAATGMAGQGATCKRVEKDRTFGGQRLLFDCAFTDPEPFHKVLVPMGDAERGALLLVQTDGEDLADTAGRITPILESWRWR